MIYRILYCSRNRIEGSTEEINNEIASILALSRKNNAAAEITGALLFNGEAFAQVLEGERDTVERTYARIRFDERHSDIVVLEEAFQPERHFTNWAMAYADRSSFLSMEDAQIDLDAVYRSPNGFAAQILGMLRSVVAAHAGSAISCADESTRREP